MRLPPAGRPLLLAAGALLTVVLATACADTDEPSAARRNDEPRELAELRAEIGELDERVTAIEQRFEAITAALGADDLSALGDEVALLVERIRALSEPSASALGLDPLFCIDPSHPEYDSAEFDVYVQGIPICGLLP